VNGLKSNKEILEDLTRELLRIGSTTQKDYDSLKKKGKVYSTTICRRLKLSWPEVVKVTGVKAHDSISGSVIRKSLRGTYIENDVPK
jgi:hypothetical protein